MTKVYFGDIGTAVVLDVGQDITAATAQSIEVRKPDSSTVSWPASVFENSKLRFVSLVGTFDAAGEWRLQAKVTLPTGTWRGDAVALKVRAPFEP